MKKIVRSAAIPLIILLFLPLLTACGRHSGIAIPKPDDRFYVYDEPDVLDSALEDYIVSTNADLYKKCGAQIVVVCVKTTGTASIEKYALKLFNDWGIGDKEKNNGVLLLLSIKEDDYWILQGKGLEKTLQSGTLKLMLDDHLEPHFAKRRYETGVRETFDALVSELEQIYSVSVTPAAQTSSGNEGGEGVASGDGHEFTFVTFIALLSVGIVAFTVIVIIIIIAIIIFIIIASLSDAGFTGKAFRASGGFTGGSFRSSGSYSNPYSSHMSWSSGRTSSGSHGGFSFGGRSSGGHGGGFSGGHHGGGGGSRGGGAGRR